MQQLMKKGVSYLLVAPSNQHRMILTHFAAQKQLYNYQLITPNELIKRATFTVTDSAFIRIARTFHVSFSKAKELIKRAQVVSLIKSEEEDFHQEKAVIKALEKEGLILFGKTPFSGEILSLIPLDAVQLLAAKKLGLGVNYTKLPGNNPVVSTGCYGNYKEEIEDVVLLIFQLIQAGVAPEAIALQCPCSSYLSYLYFLLDQVGIEYIHTASALIAYPGVNRFIKEVAQITLVDEEQLRDLCSALPPQAASAQLVHLINQYLDQIIGVSGADVAHLITFLAGTTEVRVGKGVLISNALVTERSHLFLLGAGEEYPGHLPSYGISDRLAAKYQLGSNQERYQIQSEITINQLNLVDYLYISHAQSRRDGISLFSPLLKNAFGISLDHPYHIAVDAYPEIIVKGKVVDALDEFRLYKKSPEAVRKFTNAIPEYVNQYLRYDNLFTKVARPLPKHTLSPSSLETFNSCQFKYYLKYLMKISPFEETEQIRIGNLIHHLFAHIYENDLEAFIKKEAEQFYLDKTAGYQKLFIPKLIDLLTLSAQRLKAFLAENQITISDVETAISTEVEGVPFLGKIDLLADSPQGPLIIDYKSGREKSIDEVLFLFGVQIQLQSYLLLAKSRYPEADFQFHYLSVKPPKSIAEFAKWQFKLSKAGTESNDFYCNELVKQIVKADQLIKNGDFAINPKVQKDKLIGCENCPGNIICHCTSNDEVVIEEDEDDGMD